MNDSFDCESFVQEAFGDFMSGLEPFGSSTSNHQMTELTPVRRQPLPEFANQPFAIKHQELQQPCTSGFFEQSPSVGPRNEQPTAAVTYKPLEVDILAALDVVAADQENVRPPAPVSPVMRWPSGHKVTDHFDCLVCGADFKHWYDHDLGVNGKPGQHSTNKGRVAMNQLGAQTVRAVLQMSAEEQALILKTSMGGLVESVLMMGFKARNE